ncbi:hypothetical protein GQR58_019624 [Nymphon striatum]|nr:hypothetical protein GQR58_019624 [Nymphon striatum]
MIMVEENSTVTNDNFEIVSSGDEFEESEKANNDWHPKTDKIIELFDQLQKGISLEIEWECPGRRSPSINTPDIPMELVSTANASKIRKEPDEFDFGDDFGDDFGTKDVSDALTPRGSLRSNPGSAKNKTGGPKRVARLDKVMFNIRKYRQLDDSMEDKKS